MTNEDYRNHCKQMLKQEGVDYCRAYSNYEIDDWESFIQEVEDRQTQYNPEREASFKMLLDSLSKEAKEVTSLIFNMPFELCEFICTKENNNWLTMNDLREFLRYHNWTYSAINKAFSELKKLVKKL